MNAYLALIRTNIRLAFRQKVVIFFSFLMPLAFFLIFAQLSHAAQGGAIIQVVAMVTVIGTLGAGLMGAGIRAAQERELNILRRYKVAPISPLPLLVASTITNLIVYMPFVILMLGLAKTSYGMAMPKHLGSLLIFIVLGVLAMSAIGLMVASVVNSMQESGIIVQILYMAMMFLSGATIPTAMFPNWLLTVVQFIPATWLMTGMQGIMLRNETLAANWQAVGAMLLTAAVGFFLCVKLFRWEKEEKMRPAAKLWLTAVLLPFMMLGTWQAYAKDNITKTKVLWRQMARSGTTLIRNGRIFVGDGRVIESGGVLVKGGRIVAVYAGNVPDPKTLNAQPIEAAGKTVLPGLIDNNVVLPSQRDLAAYLYSGVTAVNTAVHSDAAVKAKNLMDTGVKQGAELFLRDVPKGVASLSAAEAAEQAAAGRADLLNDSLVQQIGPPEFLAVTLRTVSAHKQSAESFEPLSDAQAKLLRAWRAGETLTVGTGAGKLLVFPGPSVQHELELWVLTGIPPQDALRAATLNSAKALGADKRIGSIEPGREATLLIVDGNPLQDIKATEAISLVMFKGETVNRQELLKGQ